MTWGVAREGRAENVRAAGRAVRAAGRVWPYINFVNIIIFNKVK